MWHRVEVVLTDVSEERITSIFRVEGKIWKSACEASIRDVKRRYKVKLSLHLIKHHAMKMYGGMGVQNFITRKKCVL
jgi:hypothetical protein